MPLKILISRFRVSSMIGIPFLGLLLAFAMSFTVPVFAGATGSSAICVDCHEDVVGQFAETLHGVVWSGSGHHKGDCESCHGPGAEHADSGDASLILNPGKTNGHEANKVCLECHKVKGWKLSKIVDNDLSCLECHSVHKPAIQGNLKMAEPGLCYQCHLQQKVDFMLPSHHPVREGKMVCTSCHNMSECDPFKQIRPNEGCLECHSAMKGPFVFEHAPVIEDCSICHNPHGAVANNLLKQNEPFICLQCHQMHFHATLQGFEGDFSTPLNPERGGRSDLDSFKKSMLTKCTQCHQKVHGSDMPSQSISGQGKALTR